jgi:twinkle protein
MSTPEEDFDKRYAEYQQSVMLPQNIDFDAWFTPEDKTKLKEASHWREDLKQHHLNPQSAKGLSLPFCDSDYLIRLGEATIHSGYNGAKKSMMLGLIQLAMISQGQKCLSVSLEMKPIITLERMVKQFSGKGELSLPLHAEFFDFVKDKLFLYDQIGTMKWKRVVGVCRYAIEECGVNQIFLDSLMKFGIGTKDLETQAAFVDEIATLAKDTNTHIHLVAHSTKPNEYKEGTPPNKYQVAGSADISNMVDNVVIHFSAKDKEYDQLFIVAKQRDPSGNIAEPSWRLHFDGLSLQFRRKKDDLLFYPEDWRSTSWK